uniref:Uncharacterized protein n=1 Tax=Cacopsylla melanoneura TaxID=428564 RepID=A0A8D9BBR1_9HEMI
MSLSHLFGGLPRGLLLCLGLHSVIVLVHLLSVRLDMCPAHFHFNVLTLNIISVTLVMFLMSSDFILSILLIPNIDLSIARCTILNLSCVVLFRTHVSHPYVRTGRTHSLKTLLFRYTGMFDLKIRALPQ